MPLQNFQHESKKCPVPLLQEPWEFDQLLQLYMNMEPKKVVEIGTFYGGTLWHWLKFGFELQQITTIDLPIPTSDGRYQEMLGSKAQWSGWIDEFKNERREFDGYLLKYTALEGNSIDQRIIKQTQALHPDNDIDFLYIDGGHDYDTVRSDWQNYSPMVKEGGVIVFHDAIGLEEVRRLWNEVKMSGVKYNEISANMNVGWGIGVVYK